MQLTVVMNKEKHRELETVGWKIGSVDEFLELSQEETEFIEVKLSLSQNLKERRQSLRLTQKDFARMIHSSHSRVAKMEAGDPAVSIDLLDKITACPQNFQKRGSRNASPLIGDSLFSVN